MEPAQQLDAEINQYLTLLTDRQKEAVLTVVKTFAEEAGHVAYSDELKKELDYRYEDYRNGGELITERDAKESIRAIINDKAEK